MLGGDRFQAKRDASRQILGLGRYNFLPVAPMVMILVFLESYSLSPGFWQSFISIEVCRDCIPTLASSCKKQLTGFFVCLLFFLKVKRIS